jgi:signal transduction histidine kinase
LTFDVDDDGNGFETSSVKQGAGLVNMHDRLDALGGEVEVTSRPGEGTHIRGVVPNMSKDHSTPAGATRLGALAS